MKIRMTSRSIHGEGEDVFTILATRAELKGLYDSMVVLSEHRLSDGIDATLLQILEGEGLGEA